LPRLPESLTGTQQQRSSTLIGNRFRLSRVAGGKPRSADGRENCVKKIRQLPLLQLPSRREEDQRGPRLAAKATTTEIALRKLDAQQRVHKASELLVFLCGCEIRLTKTIREALVQRDAGTDGPLLRHGKLTARILGSSARPPGRSRRPAAAVPLRAYPPRACGSPAPAGRAGVRSARRSLPLPRLP
jgi:hypothetical protein